MPEQQEHHEELVNGLAEQLKSVMSKSEQAIFIYLDDAHKACNKKFADLLGYKSAKEWASMDAPLADVAEKDQQKMITAYVNATEKMAASSIEANMKNVKTGELIKTRIIMVPIAYSGHLFALHFITRI